MGGFAVHCNDGKGYERRRVIIGDDLYKELVDIPKNESANTASLSNESTHTPSNQMLDRTLYPATSSTQIRDLICQIDVSNLQDRSKGDVISKGLAALQAGWFILSCISRGGNHLALTELEVSTLAFAIVSLVLYILWWNKPQSVAIQILIHPSLKLVDEKVTLEAEGKVDHTYGLLFTPLGITARTQWRTQSRVPSMWWTDSEFDFGFDQVQEDLRRIVLPSVIIGLFFGAAHCIAWNFYFPTIMERTLWRVCVVAVGIGPALVLLLMTILLFLEDKEILSAYLLYWLHIFLVYVLPYLAFFAARMSLLVLSLMALRELPSSAYQTVPWLSYILHI